MGTRGTTIVILDGEIRVQQYGQWEHYPEGAGLNVLNFAWKQLSSAEGIARFTEKVRALKTADKSYLNELDKIIANMTDLEFMNAFPEFHRDTGEGILDLIVDGSVSHVYLDPEAESWSEGIATIDLDKGTYNFTYHSDSQTFPLNDLPTDEQFLEHYIT